VLCRSREDAAIPDFRLASSDTLTTADFPQEWTASHPLTLFDLRQEVKDLKSIGVQLNIGPETS
jgi:hypothetical protein